MKSGGGGKEGESSIISKMVITIISKAFIAVISKVFIPLISKNNRF